MLKNFNCINSSFWNFDAQFAMFLKSESEFIENGNKFTESKNEQSSFQNKKFEQSDDKTIQKYIKKFFFSNINNNTN